MAPNSDTGEGSLSSQRYDDAASTTWRDQSSTKPPGPRRLAASHGALQPMQRRPVAPSNAPRTAGPRPRSNRPPPAILHATGHRSWPRSAPASHPRFIMRLSTAADTRPSATFANVSRKRCPCMFVPALALTALSVLRASMIGTSGSTRRLTPLRWDRRRVAALGAGTMRSRPAVALPNWEGCRG